MELNRGIIGGVFLIFVFLFGVLIGFTSNNDDNQITGEIISFEGHRDSTINIVAIDDNGDGVIGKLSTQVRDGSGLVLVNINDVLADVNTQFSARTAAFVASNYADVDLSNLDVIYSIETPAQLISGPSAGSAMAVTTASLLQNRPINPKVIITGSILEGGGIGKVGGISEKAKAAQEAGASLFLVPVNVQGLSYKEQVLCDDFEEGEYCKVVYRANKLEGIQGLDIEVRQVANIGEAMEVFYS